MFGRFSRLARVGRYIRPLTRNFSTLGKVGSRLRTWIRPNIGLFTKFGCGILGTFLIWPRPNRELSIWISKVKNNMEELKNVPKELYSAVIETLPKNLSTWVAMVEIDITELKNVPEQILGDVIEALPQEMFRKKLLDMNLLQGMVLSGKQFNKLIGGRALFKNTKLDGEYYDGMKYTRGRNDDIIPFKPTSTCSPGGIYFAEEQRIHFYCGYRYPFRYIVTIPDDAKVYIDDCRFKASSIIVSDPFPTYLHNFIGRYRLNKELLKLVPKDLFDFEIERTTDKQIKEIDINAFEGMVLTGNQFNKLMRGKKFFKNTNFNECQDGLQYSDGRNQYPLQFNPSGSCNGGGIYFAEVDKIDRFKDCCGSELGVYRREVIIPSDAQVYVEKDKFKADVVVLEPRVRMRAWDNA